MNRSEESQIENELKVFAAAWNRSDTQAMAGFYAADGILIDPLGQEAQGAQAIASLFQETLNGFLQGTQAEFSIERVRLLKPDVAFVDATQTVTGGRAPDGSPLPDTQFHVAMAMVRQGQQWRARDVRVCAFLPPPEA